jgi:solute carrier family 25 citrate transporter 1
MSTSQAKPSQFKSLFCGVVAGSVEGFITYPTEYVKTQAQFAAKKGSVCCGPYPNLCRLTLGEY